MNVFLFAWTIDVPWSWGCNHRAKSVRKIDWMGRLFVLEEVWSENFVLTLLHWTISKFKGANWSLFGGTFLWFVFCYKQTGLMVGFKVIGRFFKFFGSSSKGRGFLRVIDLFIGIKVIGIRRVFLLWFIGHYVLMFILYIAAWYLLGI